MRSVILLIAVVTWIPSGRASAGDHPLWFGLEPGPHVVGFQSVWELDHGRRYVTAFDDGATYGGDRDSPRPILINLWYPAVAGDDEPMRQGDYFEITPDDPAVEGFAHALVDFAEGVVVQELFGKELAALNDDEQERWSRFLDLPTACRRDAEPADGRFPLLVYHSGAGSSYEDNATLCEWLASHGHVVIGSAYPKAHGRTLAIDGGSGSVADMEFLVRYASELDFVERRRVAVAGHSAGAQVALRFAARPDCVADAIVLLDTTQDYYSVAVPTYRDLVEEVTGHADSFREPMLVMAGPSAMFGLIDRLVHAERTYLTFPHLGHNEYIAQGLQRLLMMQWAAAAAGNSEPGDELTNRARTEAGFRLVCESLREHISAVFHGTESPGPALQALGGNRLGVAPHVTFAAVGETGPSEFDVTTGRAPTPRQFRQLVQTGSIDEAVTVLKQSHESDPDAPLFESTMLTGSLVIELWVGDRPGDARRLHRCCTELGLDTLWILKFLGDMARFAGRTEEEALYREIAESLAADGTDR